MVHCVHITHSANNVSMLHQQYSQCTLCMQMNLATPSLPSQRHQSRNTALSNIIKPFCCTITFYSDPLLLLILLIC